MFVMECYHTRGLREDSPLFKRGLLALMSTRFCQTSVKVLVTLQ
jgi:hypothetical protein